MRCLTGAQDTGPSKMFCFRFVGFGDTFTSYFLSSHSYKIIVMWSGSCLSQSISSLPAFWQILGMPLPLLNQAVSHINISLKTSHCLFFREWLKIQVFHSHMPTSAECKLKEGSNAAGTHSLQIGTCLPADNSWLCPGQDLNCVRKTDDNACSNSPSLLLIPPIQPNWNPLSNYNSCLESQGSKSHRK